MRFMVFGLAMMLAVSANGSELDMLPLGPAELSTQLGSAQAGAFYDTSSGETVDLETVAARMVAADVVLLGEEHTTMDQKIFHAQLLEAMAATGRKLVLAMEFFQRGDAEALERWGSGELDDRGLLEATGWYNRGSYRWEYYQRVMAVARATGTRVIGVNVPREIPRAVNRRGLDGLSDEQRAEVGEVTTDGWPQHRYLISRYFGDTVAMLPPGWFENMYAAQCLWDVVMARSVLDAVAEDTTVVLIVGSGHIAYGFGIPARLDQERSAAGLPPLDVVTLCPVTAPAPAQDGEPTGHPMGGGGHGMGGPTASPAQFSRSLADVVAVFADRGGITAFPTLGLRLKEGDDGEPRVSIVFPDTLASEIGFSSGDVIVDVDGAAPASLEELRFLLAGLEWGQRIGVVVDRGGEPVEVSALLFPQTDTSDRSTAPGYVLGPMTGIDPSSIDAAPDHVLPEDHRHWTMVTEDGIPTRAEVHVGDLLEEVHELDRDGRVERSLYRVAREDGTVEIRYRRDASGSVEETQRFNRVGDEIE